MKVEINERVLVRIVYDSKNEEESKLMNDLYHRKVKEGVLGCPVSATWVEHTCTVAEYHTHAGADKLREWLKEHLPKG